MKRTAWVLALLVLLLLAGSVWAMRSEHYWLDWYVNLTGGGGPASSKVHAANVTIGQTARGLSSSKNCEAGLGYWVGVEMRYAIYLPLVWRSAP